MTPRQKEVTRNTIGLLAGIAVGVIAFLMVGGKAWGQMNEGEATIEEGMMLATVWTVHSDAQDCIDYEAVRCYVWSENDITMYEKNENGVWEQVGLPRSTNLPYENPLLTSCGALNLNCPEAGVWVGTQWTTMRPWLTGVGDCSDTVWGCRP